MVATGITEVRASNPALPKEVCAASPGRTGSTSVTAQPSRRIHFAVETPVMPATDNRHRSSAQSRSPASGSRHG